MAVVDATHHGSLVDIAAWVVMVSAIVITLAKVATKWLLIERLEKDDWIMGVAVVFAIAQTLAASLAVGAGLGQPMTALSTDLFHRYEKASLAADILYIATVNLAKIAPLVIQAGLCKTTTETRTVNGIACFSLLWMVVGMLCVAFRCQVPDIWDTASGKCFDQLAFWTVNAVFDILTQLSLAILPCWIFYSLQCSWAKKRHSILSFTPCVLTIPLTIMRLVYLYRAAPESDVTMAAYHPALLTEIHANFSVLAGCIPFMKPLIEAVSVGMITNDLILVSEKVQSDIGQRQKGSKTFILLGGRAFNQGPASSSSIGVTTETNASSLRDLSQSGGVSTTVVSAIPPVPPLPPLIGDFGFQHHENRQGSQQPMSIYQTTTIDVSSVPK